MARVWLAANGKLWSTYPDIGAKIEFSADGERIGAIGLDGAARIWNVGDQALVATLFGHSAPLTDIAFAPTGAGVLTTSQDGEIGIWPSTNGRLVSQTGNLDVSSVGFSPDSKTFLTIGNDCLLTKWDAATSNKLSTANIGKNDGAQLSSKGQRIFAVGPDHVGRLWAAGDATPVAKLTGSTGQMLDGRFTHDDQRLVTHNGEGDGWVWDAHSGKSLGALSKEEASTFLSRSSSDGKRSFVVFRDGTIQIKDTAGEVASFSTGGEEIVSADIDPDANRAVTLAQNTARIWDLETRSLLASFPIESQGDAFPPSVVFLPRRPARHDDRQRRSGRYLERIGR